MKLVRESHYYNQVALSLAEEEDYLLNNLLSKQELENDMTSDTIRVRCKREYDHKIRIFKAKAWVARWIEKTHVLVKRRNAF